MKKILTVMLLAHWVAVAMCQTIGVQAPKSVYVGDNFTVRFTIDARVSSFADPDFGGLRKLQGPSTSMSSSISFAGGRSTATVQSTYSYVLGADKEGTFTIGPATCKVDGKELHSESWTVSVVKPTAAQQAQRQQQQQQQQRRAYNPWGDEPQQSAAAEITDKNLFVRASVSKTNPYQGEQVIVTYKIYTQVAISDYGIDKLPDNRGFWAEDLTPQGGRMKQYEEVVDGQRYQVAEIRRGALFAQQSGNLAIEPLDMTVLAMVQRSRRRTGSIFDLLDDAFFNSREAVQRQLSSRRIAMKVKPLPDAPDGFTGAVGHFDVEGGLAEGTVKLGDAVSYKITISGAGNLMLVGAPSPKFPSTFEAYEPQVDDNLHRGENGVSGSRTYEWVIIPRSQGQYTIPELQFVYFDPSAGRYVTKTIAAQTLEVAKGDGRGGSQGVGKDDVKLLGNDIGYIHPIGSLSTKGDGGRVPLVFWIVLAAVVLATVGADLYIKKHRADELDVVGTRQKRAVRMARKRLKQAEVHLRAGEQAPFYEAIYRAIWGCLADKYSIELSRLSRETVAECLQNKQVADEQQARIMKVLQDVDMARFAPGDAHAQMQSIYDETLQTIVALS